MHGFALNCGVRSDLANEIGNFVQVVGRTQNKGLFRIQNPLPQGFDPILSSALKIFLFLLQSGEGAHESVFFGEIDIFWYVAVEIYADELLHALLARFDL